MNTSYLTHKETNLIRFPSTILGYVTPWNRDGYIHARLFRSKLTHVSPVWYQVRKQGNKFVLTGGQDVDREWMADLRSFGSSSDILSGWLGDATSTFIGDWFISRFSNKAMSKRSTRTPRIVPRVIFELTPFDMYTLLTGYDAETGKQVAAPRVAEVLALLHRERHVEGYDGWVIEGWSSWSASGLLNVDMARIALYQMLAALRHGVNSWDASPYTVSLDASPPSTMMTTHTDGGQVIVAVSPPLKYDAATRSSSPSPLLTLAQYQELRRVVDAVSLMTYDATADGPNAPLDWMAQTVETMLHDQETFKERAMQTSSTLSFRQFFRDEAITATMIDSDESTLPPPQDPMAWCGAAAATCPPPPATTLHDVSSRLLLGLHFYGNVRARAVGDSCDAAAHHAAAAASKTITYPDFVQLLGQHTPSSLAWDPVWHENTFSFRSAVSHGCYREHTVHYPTPFSLYHRIELAKALGLGLSIWELGQAPSQWFDLL